MEGQECMKVLKRVNEDLLSLGSKVTRQKVELVALEKVNEKMLKLMECINLALEHIDNWEEQAEKWDKRIRALEEEEEELKQRYASVQGWRWRSMYPRR